MIKDPCYVEKCRSAARCFSGCQVDGHLGTSCALVGSWDADELDRQLAELRALRSARLHLDRMIDDRIV